MENTEITALTTQITADALIHWTDEKRKEFIGTFDQRVRASQLIFLMTAKEILTKAREKSFVSYKEAQDLLAELEQKDTSGLYDLQSKTAHDGINYRMSGSYRLYTIGGRPYQELVTIAQERARLILESLPPLREAVRIISPDVARMIEERDKLADQGRDLMKEADEVSGPIDMDDFDGNTTIAEFKNQIKIREKKRQSLLEKLSETGKEGAELHKKIDKFLYTGVPGLSEAVLKVAENLLERFTALGSMFRRVSEQVQFGDSKAALEVLSGFERDEISVSEDIKAQFTHALDVLKLAGQPKVPKQIKKGKK